MADPLKFSRAGMMDHEAALSASIEQEENTAYKAAPEH
jgi:hypothetical protein